MGITDIPVTPDLLRRVQTIQEFTAGISNSKFLSPERSAPLILDALRVVDNPIGIEFSSQVESIHIPFCTSVSHVPPDVITSMGQLGEEMDDLSFDLMGIDPKVTIGKRIPHVINTEFKKAEQLRIIEIEVTRVT